MSADAAPAVPQDAPPVPGTILDERVYGAAELFGFFHVDRALEGHPRGGIVLTVAAGFAPGVGQFLARGYSPYRARPAHTVVTAAIADEARVLELELAGTDTDPGGFALLLAREAMPRLAKLIADAADGGLEPDDETGARR